MKRRSVWRNSNKPYVLNDSIEWIQSGEKYYDKIVLLIDSAQSEIHLQTYIFSSDQTGAKIANALIRAANRGVSIYVLIDAYGSQTMTMDFQKQMESAGIIIRRYGVFFSSGRFHISRRLHRKVLVIDGSIAVVGGINISDHYAGTEKAIAWLDFAAIVIGQTASRLAIICRKRWKLEKFPKTINSEKKTTKIDRRVLIRVRRNDFIRNQNEIAITYRQAIRRAERSLVIVGGYFLPGGRTRRLLRAAIDRGVSIKVLVAEKSDVGIMAIARRYLYGWLTKNGIDVFEYRTSNVHGKVLIKDNEWTTIGSYDLNNLSTYSNIELNLDINDINFSKSIQNHIEHILETECTAVTAKSSYLHKNIFIRLKCWFAYRFVKIMFVLTVVLAGKREKDF